jgi:hypothetical protein
MRAEIVFEIDFGVAKWHDVLLEQRVYLEAGLELKEPSDLSRPKNLAEKAGFLREFGLSCVARDGSKWAVMGADKQDVFV